MKELELAMYGEEQEYLTRLEKYLNKHGRGRIAARCLKTEEELRRFVRDRRPALMLLPRDLTEEFSAYGRVLYLSEEEIREDERALYRYQPAEKLIRELLKTGAESPEEGSAPAKLLAFYSPVHGCGQTAAAFLAGHFLAEEAPVLYFTTARYSGLEAVLPREKTGTLSDLLYYARVDGDIPAALASFTEYDGSLAFLTPAADPGDLRSAGEADWKRLVSALRTSGRFALIVLDLGDGIAEENWLLEEADAVFMPLRTDRLSGFKEAAWREQMQRSGHEAVLARTKSFVLPETEEVREFMDYRALRFTEWGRFLHRLLKENGL